ncbi:sialidase-like [Chelonus insularis]|uniref:sialidase-like n=1 Tax=Chelonus insularis TaxID=460826 RepID=UPI001588AFD0|nr:sialidase-like [Chelonus insularis]
MQGQQREGENTTSPQFTHPSTSSPHTTLPSTRRSRASGPTPPLAVSAELSDAEERVRGMETIAEQPESGSEATSSPALQQATRVPPTPEPSGSGTGGAAAPEVNLPTEPSDSQTSLIPPDSSRNLEDSVLSRGRRRVPVLVPYPRLPVSPQVIDGVRSTLESYDRVRRERENSTPAGSRLEQTNELEREEEDDEEEYENPEDSDDAEESIGSDGGDQEPESPQPVPPVQEALNLTPFQNMYWDKGAYQYIETPQHSTPTRNSQDSLLRHCLGRPSTLPTFDAHTSPAANSSILTHHFPATPVNPSFQPSQPSPPLPAVASQGVIVYPETSGFERRVSCDSKPKPKIATESVPTPRTPSQAVTITVSRDGLTYSRDNVVHFLSADCELAQPVSKLLQALHYISVDDLKAANPLVGQVFATPLGKHRVFTVFVKKHHFD